MTETMMYMDLFDGEVYVAAASYDPHQYGEEAWQPLWIKKIKNAEHLLSLYDEYSMQLIFVFWDCWEKIQEVLSEGEEIAWPVVDTWEHGDDSYLLKLGFNTPLQRLNYYATQHIGDFFSGFTGEHVEK